MAEKRFVLVVGIFQRGKGEWENKVCWYSVQLCMYVAYATVLNTAINCTCDLISFSFMGREKNEQSTIKKVQNRDIIDLM